MTLVAGCFPAVRCFVFAVHTTMAFTFVAASSRVGTFKMGRWFLSKLDAVALPVMLAFRAVRRALCPVAHCKVHGLSIAIRISTPNEHHRANTYATKEPETIEWLRENLRDGDVFYDVGANIGLYSLYAAKLRPACRVFAFEPESHNFGSLCGNLLLNRVENVTPCFFPLSSHEDFAPFYVYDLQPGGALHSLGRPSPLRDGPPLLTTGAIAVTIDVLVSHHELPAPNLLKLDVDGNEEKILDGAAAVLASGLLRSILVEVTGPDECKPALSWAESKLGPYGYHLKERSAWSIELSGLRSANFIFVR
jgi:FkbM family methyltransferase